MSDASKYQILSPASPAMNRWFKVAMFNFLLAGCIGLLLRFAFVNELKWLDYKAFQNAHAHLALLGWGFLGFAVLLIKAYATPEVTQSKIKTRLFWLSEILILLIALSFAAFKERAISNALLILLSFVVFVFVYRFIAATRAMNKERVSYSFAVAALIFLCVSFFGTYVLVYSLLISGAKKVLLFYLSSQFFLHFQYNGWFTFAGLALFFRWAEEKGISLDAGKNKKILIGLILGVVLTYFISLFWGHQNNFWYLGVASLGGLIQIIILLSFRKYLSAIISGLVKTINKYFKILLLVSLFCFCLKLFMQVIIVVPFIANLAFTIRNYVIAYIHLVFIGMTSLFLLVWAIEHNFVTIAKTVRFGLYSMVTGFILVELLLFVQGTLLWLGEGFLSNYYPLLFGLNVFIPAGLLIIVLKNFKYLPYKNQLQ